MSEHQDQNVMGLRDCVSDLIKIECKLHFLSEAMESDNDDFRTGLVYILDEIKGAVARVRDGVDLNDIKIAKERQ